LETGESVRLKVWEFQTTLKFETPPTASYVKVPEVGAVPVVVVKSMV
jgi:hypothetical protein